MPHETDTGSRPRSLWRRTRRYLKRSKQDLFRNALSVAITLGAFVAGDMISKYVLPGNQHVEIGMFALLFVALYLVWMGPTPFDVSESHPITLPELVADFEDRTDFQADIQLAGSPVTLLFDTKARRFAYVTEDWVVEQPYNFIRAWSRFVAGQGSSSPCYRIEICLNDRDSTTWYVTTGLSKKEGTLADAEFWAANLRSLVGAETLYAPAPQAGGASLRGAQ